MSNFFQQLQQPSPEKFQIVRDRLEQILRAVYPEISTAPNTPYGDTMLTPLALLVGAVEESLKCVMDDMDLARLAKGEACDCDWAIEYVRRFLPESLFDVPSIGMVKLLFLDDVYRDIQNTTRFLFRNDVLLQPVWNGDNLLQIYPSTSNVGDLPGVYRLSPVAGGFAVEIPVYGPGGIQLQAGLAGQSDLDLPGLASITTAGPLVPIMQPQDLSSLVALAQKVFPSAALTTRGSTVSFFHNRIGTLKAVSPVLPGDQEMLRGSDNAFGLSQNAIDIYLKGDTYMHTTRSRLVWDPVDERWYGRWVPQHPPMRIRQIFTPDGEVLQQDQYRIYSHNTDPNSFPGDSYGFTRAEALGIQTHNASPVGPAPLVYDSTPISPAVGEGGLVLDGTFRGHPLASHSQFSLRLELVSVVGDAHTFRLTNTTLPSQAPIEWAEDIDSNSHTLTPPASADPWVRGIEFIIPEYAQLDGAQWVIPVRGVGGEVLIEYDSDPVLTAARDLMDKDSLQTAFDLSLKSFYPLIIEELEVLYRTRPGKWTDLGAARSEILKAFNSGGYPNLPESGIIVEALLRAGALSVRHFSLRGRVLSTIADYRLEGTRLHTDGGNVTRRADLDDEEINDTFPVPPPVDLEGSINFDTLWFNEPNRSLVIGPRNTQYILPAECLKLSQETV